MMIDFYEVFGENADEDNGLPQEVLEELNKDLPENLIYFQDENGRYCVVPKPDRKEKLMKLTTRFDLDQEKDSVLIKRLRVIPCEKWAEYFYRTQKSIPVKEVKIGNDEQLIPLEQTVGNPLSDEKVTLNDCKMFPEKFPKPVHMIFESEEGVRVSIAFQQVPYDSLSEIKIQNIDFPALKIELYVYAPLTEGCEKTARTSENNPVCVNYSVTPTNASSATMALDALRIFKGLFTGKTKVNGQVIVSASNQAEFDPQRIEDAFLFWETAVKLEKILGVDFVPDSEFPVEEAKLFSELAACLLEKKKIVWKHPFDHFGVSAYNSETEGWSMDMAIDQKNLYFNFIEGPFQCELLGVKFEIFSFTEMEDFIITNIEWNDAEKQRGEIYIADAPGKTWTLKRLYMTKENADKIQNKESEEGCNQRIPMEGFGDQKRHDAGKGN